jgi:hypothetical protein
VLHFLRSRDVLAHRCRRSVRKYQWAGSVRVDGIDLPIYSSDFKALVPGGQDIVTQNRDPDTAAANPPAR